MDRLKQLALSRAIRRGNLEVTLASGQRFRVGDGSGTPIVVRSTNAAHEWRLLRDPEVALGELYMDDAIAIEKGSIFDIIDLGAQNLAAVRSLPWVRLLMRLRYWMQRAGEYNNRRKSKRNVAHHYDIDARIYSLFLDSDLQYSCAYFEAPEQSLEAAQLAKKRHIAAKLAIAPGMRVLDIGCGWGGMALYLARHCEANVTGVTLSQEQFSIATRRVSESGLGDQVAFRLQDYRDVPEQYDRIVSVGMFEHVGRRHYDTFFRKMAETLTPDGVALLHTIGRTDSPGPMNLWMVKYIFPGAFVPALSEAIAAIERAGLYVADVEILRLHYALTLKAWRERFTARREEAKAIYDERFCRMWEFYLAGNEAAFRIGENVVFQIQIAKKIDGLRIRRDYMSEREAALRRQDGAIAANA